MFVLLKLDLHGTQWQADFKALRAFYWHRKMKVIACDHAKLSVWWGHFVL